MPGLTPEQRDLLEQRFCANGHRFDGANYPTPEGICPLCAVPEVRDQVAQYQRLIAEQPTPYALHPAITTIRKVTTRGQIHL